MWRMGLNISKGNMYDFVTHTWNTIKGACPHDCQYCYMKRWGDLKPTRFDEKELKTDLGSGNYIFVGSSCDMFATGILHDWIFRTLKHCYDYPGNKYFFQSKNPGAFPVMIEEYEWFPEKFSICTTIETNRIYTEMGIENRVPEPEVRAHCLGFNFLNPIERYVTIEPIMDFDVFEMVDLIKISKARQVNIGADSGGNELPEPTKDKIENLISELRNFTKVKLKKNISRLGIDPEA